MLLNLPDAGLEGWRLIDCLSELLTLLSGLKRLHTGNEEAQIELNFEVSAILIPRELLHVVEDWVRVVA